MNFKKLIVVGMAAALVCGAMAQGGGGFGGGQGRRGGMFGQGGDSLQLTGREDVQKDLSLTDDQKAKLTDLRDKQRQKMRDAMQSLRDSGSGDPQEMMKAMGEMNAKMAVENAKAVAEILSADQVKRLKEIKVQFSGIRIVTSDKEIQKDLSVTEEQTKKFQELQTKQMTAMRELFQSAQGDRQAMQEGMAKNQKIMDEEINKILTDAQKAKFKEMGGTKKFERVDPPQGGGGR